MTQHYRAYRLDPTGRIVFGEWIAAADVEEAKTMANEFCDDATPMVELWLGAQRLARVTCD